MKISILNSLYVGGAANSARRLHEGLRLIGVDSTFFNTTVEDDRCYVRKCEVQRKTTLERFGGKAKRLLSRASLGLYSPFRTTKVLPGHELFSDCVPTHTSFDFSVALTCDVLNLHWVAQSFDIIKVLRNVGARMPIVWTLHDMRPFTGGCHYDDNCGKYKSFCRSCPQLVSPGERDSSNINFSAQKQAMLGLSDTDIHVVAPSKWMMQCVKESALLGRFNCSHIPYGVCTDTFKPFAKCQARKLLGLPNDAFILLFVAASVANFRKGLDLLLESVEHLRGASQELILLSVGGGAGPKFVGSIRHIHYGSLANDSLLAAVYSAASVFVIPSRQDNLPNTMIESISCGTPVVGFNVGGIPDVVREGETGWLSPDLTAEGLGEVLKKSMLDLQRSGAKITEECRATALKEYPIRLQATRYVELYNEMLRLSNWK